MGILIALLIVKSKMYLWNVRSFINGLTADEVLFVIVNLFADWNNEECCDDEYIIYSLRQEPEYELHLHSHTLYCWIYVSFI